MKTQQKHTPGIAHVARYGNNLEIQCDCGNGKFQQIARIFDYGDGPECPIPVFANARRLAHCWNCHDDLLAALKALTEYDFSNSDDDPERDREIWDQARAAIAKAEGGGE